MLALSHYQPTGVGEITISHMATKHNALFNLKQIIILTNIRLNTWLQVPTKNSDEASGRREASAWPLLICTTRCYVKCYVKSIEHKTYQHHMLARLLHEAMPTWNFNMTWQRSDVRVSMDYTTHGALPWGFLDTSTSHIKLLPRIKTELVTLQEITWAEPSALYLFNTNRLISPGIDLGNELLQSRMKPSTEDGAG